jgi:hypothetical protein
MGPMGSDLDHTERCRGWHHPPEARNLPYDSEPEVPAGNVSCRIVAQA